MKRLLEELMLSTTDSVLDQFASLPGARVGKNWVYIEGNRPENERILLVGHADTVFSDPPKCISWNGNVATAGNMQDKRELKEYPSRFAPKEAEKKEPEPQAAQTEATAAPPVPPAPPEDTAIEKQLDSTVDKIAEIAGASRQEIERIKKAVTVTIGNQTMSLADYEIARRENKFQRPPTTSYTDNRSSTTTYGRNRTGNDRRRTGGPAGLGADDRAGLAVLWALRKSGHSILVTDCEEVGCIGAQEAAKEIGGDLAKHLFAIEIDRTGDQEVVFYDVGTREFEEWILAQSGKGWRVGIGSSTDIKAICGKIGICGVNFAAGYWFAHSEKEMLVYDAWLRTYNVVQRICKLPADKLRRFELPKAAPAPQQGGGASVQRPLALPAGGQTGQSPRPAGFSHSPASSGAGAAKGNSGKGQTDLEKEFGESLLAERSLRSQGSSGSSVVTTTAPAGDMRTSIFDLQDVMIDLSCTVTREIKESETLLNG
jgi:flagellar motor switch/type III secretory pathway protein FliN